MPKNGKTGWLKRISFKGEILRSQRGLSEILSVLLVTFIIFGFSSLLFTSMSAQTKEQAWGIVDAVYAQERRMNQLLSFIHSRLSADNVAEIYIYNYGSENVALYKVYFGTGEHLEEKPFELKNAVSGQTITELPPGVLVKFVYRNISSGVYYFVLVTQWRAYYSWQVSL